MTSNTDSSYSMNSPGSRYIGFNAGKSNFKLNNGLGAFPSDSKDTSYSLYGGSYFNKNFGLELGYTDFGRVARAGGTTRANGINLSAVGRLPLSPSFNVLGKLGTTYGHTDVSAAPASGVTSGSERGFGVSYGLGAEYAFTPAVSAVLQYDEHKLRFVNAGRDTVGTTSVGLRYNF
ncbi:MAG: outer membrane beta-barrel protein [Polaromonas sp.]|nr:outer membrane beta-barrel protein [Polaromonas sp.]